LGQLARHRIRSAVDGPGRRAAVSACRRAAEAELRRLAFTGAAQWYDEALELSDAGPERCELLLGRAEVAFRDGQVEQALETCAAAMDQAERLGRADLAAASALVVRGIGGVVAGRALAALCERAFAVLGAAEDEPALEARLHAQHSMALAEGVSVGLAEPVSRRAMELAERSGDPLAVIDALNSRRLVLSGPEGVAELTALGRRMREVSALAGRPESALWGHAWCVDAALQEGAIDTVDAEIFELTTLVDRLRWPLARWHLLRIQATRAVLTGRFTEAGRLIDACRTVAQQTQDASAQLLFYSALTNLLTLTGPSDRYADDFRRMEDHAEMPLLLASRSVFHLRTGDTRRAAVLFERFRSRLDGLQREPRWLAAMFFAGELAAGLSEVKIAKLCYDRLLPFEPYYVNLGPGCSGSVARVLGLLAGALGDLDVADAHLARAVAMETRIGALPFLALAQLDHAALLGRRRATGDRDRAVRLAEAAGRTARNLGMAPVAGGAARLLNELSGVRGGAATLTPQERTVAGLVARGRTNQQIAGELVVSVRTVETHMRNILRKVGLTNRTELAAWALRHDLGA
ncbi:MAG: LuxR C-terminal-related transcriptional regulator, partial [Actinoallomurus sp.]